MLGLRKKQPEPQPKTEELLTHVVRILVASRFRMGDGHGNPLAKNHPWDPTSTGACILDDRPLLPTSNPGLNVMYALKFIQNIRHPIIARIRVDPTRRILISVFGKEYLPVIRRAVIHLTRQISVPVDVTVCSGTASCNELWDELTNT